MPKLHILVPTLIDFMDNFIVSFSLFMGEDWEIIVHHVECETIL
jgi:hypothetical protein